VLDARIDFSGRKGIYAGIACPTGANIAVTDCWGGKTFNDRQVGKYIRTYGIKDASENTKIVYRTFHNVDMTAPIIQVKGLGEETFQASREIEYTDQGATCQDHVDGDISHNVEVSGEIVNMKVPGQYHLQYDCQDNSGNMAERKFRTITIEDKFCPWINMQGDAQVFVEAGFPYVDAGATATDTLDGDITARVRSVGNTVDTAEAFYYAKSCAEIAKIAASPTHLAALNGHKKKKIATVKVNSGEYYITTDTTFSGKTKTEAVVVTCNMATKTTFFKLNAQRAAQNNKLVHHVVTTQESKYSDRYPTCEEYGFVAFDAATASNADKTFAKTEAAGYDMFVSTGQHTDMRLCTKAATSSFSEDSALANYHAPSLRAETGSYVINYYVNDLNGNAQCSIPSRSVIVKDTLPPVISLHYKNKLLNELKGSRSTLKNPATHRIGKNPAQPAYGNPHYGAATSLMAQAATSNGWIIAAAASGIAGVALFSYSFKKSSDMVPV